MSAQSDIVRQKSRIMRRKLQKESFRPLPKVLSKIIWRSPKALFGKDFGTLYLVLKRHCRPQRFRGAFILAPIVLGWVREILAERKHKYHAAGIKGELFLLWPIS